jgi:hypothetical protein
MPRGGARPGSGPKPKPRLPHVSNKAWAAVLVELLNKPGSGKESEEIKGWRKLWNAEELRIRLDTRKYLYDQAHGKATQPIDHGAGGPIKVEVTTNVKMADPHGA